MALAAGLDPLRLAELEARLQAGPRLSVLTGAGVSAASGVPTYRGGGGGMWRGRRAQDLATREAFVADPALVWEWYDERRRRLAVCQPNPAHATLAVWSRQLSVFTLITQNVDGLHERAGTRNVLRFHGSIWHLRCAGSCWPAPAPWEDLRPALPVLPPRCPACGGLARPGVVWFGEAIEPSVLAAAEAAVDCDLFLAIGTSAVVWPAAGLLAAARACGAFVVEVNPEPTGGSHEVDLVLRGPAEDILPRIRLAPSS